MRLARLLLLPIVCLLLLAGCGQPQPDPPGEGTGGRSGLRVVGTVGMVTDLAARIVGDRGTVHTIIAPGVDPHLYAPSRDDLNALMGADVIVYSGLQLEGRMTDILAKAGSSKPVLAVAEAIPADKRLAGEGGSGKSHDPHLWMAPGLWAHAAEAMVDFFCEVDPEGAEDYRARGAELVDEIRALDAWAGRVLTTIPAGSRVLVTAHDAFGYFGAAYGIEVHGIQGLSTESEAGLHDINRLVDLLVARGVPAVFVESTVADKNVRALIEGTQSRGHEVAIGGELYSDAMGAAGTYEGTYVGMIDHNVTVIARALGADVPEGGWKGLLGRGPGG